jgi:hypothetical protein
LPYILALRSLSAFPTTDAELKLIAAAAIIGLSNNPAHGTAPRRDRHAQTAVAKREEEVLNPTPRGHQECL